MANTKRDANVFNTSIDSISLHLKNIYLEEIKKIENLTEMFLTVAQNEAEEQRIMTMQDWINETDNLLKYRKKDILKSTGSISHRQAIDKANNEYEKFRVKQDKELISSMDELYKKYLEESKK